MKKVFPFLLIVLLAFLTVGCLSVFDIPYSSNPTIEETSSFLVSDSIETSSSEETSVDSVETSEESSSEASESVDFTKLTVNCLGDSLTYGANPNGSQMASPFPQLLKNELGFAVVNNFGIGGTKIANEDSSSFCVRYKDMPDADIVLVMGGTNDALSFSLDMVYRTPLGDINSMDDKTFYGALNSLCYKLRNKYPDSFIAFITPLPLADEITAWTTASGSFSVEQAGIAVKEVCAKYNIPVFDAYNLTGYGAICNEEKLSGSGDGIHPSQEFWALDFTPKLAEFIRQNYRGK